MAKIITETQLQSIDKLTRNDSDTPLIVTIKGQAKFIMLPYFESNESAVSEYLEDYEMEQNKGALKERYQQSINSGVSTLTI